MDNLIGILDIKRTNKLLNAGARELLVGEKRVDERIDENVLHWLGHAKKSWNRSNSMKLGEGERMESRSVSRSRKGDWLGQQLYKKLDV